ncbi:Rpn family recombination-promoting nuclease/putative transposase [Oceanobacillus timonensis]|uniref:Rpn family recombination-promoting nuclease/putative transposase n=1 Tax=Oceanobacillus timonensis TaxID=1926285 RepID=UPI0009BA4C78|nr:Rpn family recombination-promoting nuclease/putative transposase [Oceanobacillus timonensis]
MIHSWKIKEFPSRIGENGEVYRNSIPKKEFHQLMDLKIDVAFKKLFGDERYKKITIAFLNAFFIQSKRAPIKDMTFQEEKMTGSELPHLSLVVETENKESIYVEILFPDQDAPENQSFYFWSDVYRRQFATSSAFGEYDGVITISIMHFEIFHESDKYHSIFRLTDKEEPMMLTNLQESHFIEVPKLIHRWNEGSLNWKEDALTGWLLLLAVVDSTKHYFHLNMYQALEKIAATDKHMAAAMKAWSDISCIDENQLIYKDRQKQIIEQQFLKEIEITEEKRKVVQERTEQLEQKYQQIKKQYEQQKLELVEEKEKRMEAE